MWYAWIKASLKYCMRSVRVGKPQCESMEALMFHIETLLNPFALQMSVTSSSCSSSFNHLSCVVLFEFLVQTICLSRTSSSASLTCYISSSSFLSKQKLANPMAFVITGHMSYAWSKGALSELRVGKPQRGSMEALIFHRNITKTFALQTNATSSRSSSSSSSKLFICLFLF